jgi:hypothetical protein
VSSPPSILSSSASHRLFTALLVRFAGGVVKLQGVGESSGPEGSVGEDSGTRGAGTTWFVASPPAVFRRRRRRRRQRWAIGAGVLDGGARSRQESEISWEPEALRIATRAVKPLATHSSYKWKKSSLGEKEDCRGLLVAFTLSRTTLAQDGAALESEGSEPAGGVSRPFLNPPSTPVKGEAGR